MNNDSKLTLRPWLAAYPAGVRHDINPDATPSLAQLIEDSLRRHASRTACSVMDRDLRFARIDC